MTTPKAHSITDFLSWLETKATKDAVGASPRQVSGAVRLFLGAVPDAGNPPALAPFIEGLKASAGSVTSARGEPLTSTTASGYITRIKRAYKAFASPRTAKAAPKSKPAAKAAAKSKAKPTAKASAAKAPKRTAKASAKSKAAPRSARAKRATPQVTHVEAAPESAFGVSARTSIAPRSSRATSSRTMVPQKPAGDMGPFGRVNIGELEATSKTISKLLRQARAAS